MCHCACFLYLAQDDITKPVCQILEHFPVEKEGRVENSLWLRLLHLNISGMVKSADLYDAGDYAKKPKILQEIVRK